MINSVAILGIGFLGNPLAQQLQMLGMNVVAMRRTAGSWGTQIPTTLADFTELSLCDWQIWQAYKTWVCLIPPSSSQNYLVGLSTWLSAAKYYGVEHIVYSSSTSVYGSTGVCHEQSDLRPETLSAQSIQVAEQQFLNSGIKHIDILRFGGLYSPQRHPIYTLQKKSMNSGRCCPVNMISQDCAVRSLVWAITHPSNLRIRNLVELNHPSKEIFYTQQAAKLGTYPPQFDMTDHHQYGKIVGTIYHDFLPILLGHVEKSEELC